jgi:hypothetical protein
MELTQNSYGARWQHRRRWARSTEPKDLLTMRTKENLPIVERAPAAMAPRKGRSELRRWSMHVLFAVVAALSGDLGCTTADTVNGGPIDSWPIDASDVQPPPDDPDAECACMPPDAQWGTGGISLSCFCRDGCMSFEAALVHCPLAIPDFNRVYEYDACNLVRMTFGGGFGGSQLVYDATTHGLVGGSRSSDTPSYRCGARSVFGVVAGVFPPDDCPVSAERPRCP